MAAVEQPGRAEYHPPRDVPEARPSRPPRKPRVEETPIEMEQERSPMDERYERTWSLAQMHLKELLKTAKTADPRMPDDPNVPDALSRDRDALRADYRELLDLQREVISQPTIPRDLAEKIHEAIAQIEDGLDQADLTFRRRQFDEKNAKMRPHIERNVRVEPNEFADKWNKGAAEKQQEMKKAKKKGFFGWVKSLFS